MEGSSSIETGQQGLAGLPLETQKQIVAHVSSKSHTSPSTTADNSQVGRKDLFSLQTVSRQFHSLASAELYRHLDFNIVSDESEDVGSIASRAADALQTILASENGYGQHIKSFRMGAVAGNMSTSSRHYNAFEDQLIMTRLLWDSKKDPSKFLNTALLLLARSTPVLETFKWVDRYG